MHRLIRIGACGVCGTDLHILKGDVPEVTDGRILGHEAVKEAILLLLVAASLASTLGARNRRRRCDASS